MRTPILRVLLLVLVSGTVVPAGEAIPDPVAGDEKLLADHGVGRDGPALLKFLRLRSPADEDRRVVARLLRALGSESFEEREAATQDLVARGPSVLDDLKRLEASPDPEVRRRAAQALIEIEGGPGAALPSAVVRLVAVRDPDGAVPTLLRYLPFADDELVEEEIVAALDRLSRGHPPEPALLAALRHPLPVVRGVAGQVVARTAAAAQRAGVLPLLKDADATVRFRTALGLVAARQAEGVAALIDLLEQDRESVGWQAEEVLYRLAGEKGPTATTSLATPEERRKARAVWAAWWREHGGAVDLAALEGSRQLGLTLGIEYNTGRVWEAGPDRSLRFELKGLQGPMEAQVLSAGRILVAESNAHQVTERDLRGNVLWTVKPNGEPTGCQRLPNGNTFVSTYSKVMEYTRDGKVAYEFSLPQGSNAIRKHRNGNIIFATDSDVVELDTAGREVRRVPLPKESMWVGLRDLSGDRFLAANSSSGRVVEIDRTGKILWEGRVPGACGVERTASGHTLVATSNRVVELDRAGNTVWEIRSPGYVRRVHRR